MQKFYLSIRAISILLIFFFLQGCTQQSEISAIPVEITIDNETITTEAEIGSTIQTILSSQQIVLQPLDKVDPPVFTVITEPISIIITRVEEKFESEEIVIPFEQQSVRNEALPERQNILIQPGVNGLREITYRLLFENGQLFSRTEVRSVEIIDPKPEIIMIGVQSPFSSVQISGKLIYLSSGNAWMMENQTSNRTPILTNGKLDGRILNISPNGKWLLFSQIGSEEEKINELWLINLESEDSKPVYLKVDNVIHFATWKPGNTLAVLVSTVEPRDVAPGWQANNNLLELTLGADGKVLRTREVLETNSGGIYGWWGTNFEFSPDGKTLAFIRPDTLGLMNFKAEELENLIDIIPFQTKSDWAWVSPFSWSPNNRFIYWVDHQKDHSLENPELSTIFDLKAFDIKTNQSITASENVGMFAFSSIIQSNENLDNFRLAFLKAIFPENSNSSRYRLLVSDRDGSNSQVIFPLEDMQGLEPQKIYPSPCSNEQICQLGFIYQGNLWIIDINNQYTTHQITGDGLITRIEWK